MGWAIDRQSLKRTILIGSNTPTTTNDHQTCVEVAEGLVKRWRAFFGQLFVKFMDGNVKTMPDPNQLLPTVEQPGYSLAWRDRIVAETDGRFRVPDGNEGVGAADAMARDVAAVEGRRRHSPRWKGM